MTAATLPVTRREAILAHLAGHPGLTASELARVIGCGRYLGHLLDDMTYKGQVVSRPGYRPGQAREVRLWSVAPPGTIPPPRPPLAEAVLARKRERDRRTTNARRARSRGAVSFAGLPALYAAACAGTDPELFFPSPGDTGTESAAKAVCAGCPERARCLEGARAAGITYGIWGGVNLSPEPRPAEGPSQP